MRPGELRLRTLRALETGIGHPSDIAETIGSTRMIVEVTLRRFVRDGFARKIGRARWGITRKGTTELEGVRAWFCEDVS